MPNPTVHNNWKAINSRAQQQPPTDNKADNDDDAKRIKEKGDKGDNGAKEGDNEAMKEVSKATKTCDGNKTTEEASEATTTCDSNKTIEEASEATTTCDGDKTIEEASEDTTTCDGDKTIEEASEDTTTCDGDKTTEEASKATKTYDNNKTTEEASKATKACDNSSNKNADEDIEMNNNKNDKNDLIGCSSNPIVILDESEEPQTKRQKRSTHNSHRPRRRLATPSVIVSLDHIKDQLKQTWTWQRRGEKCWKDSKDGTTLSGEIMAKEKHQISLHARYMDCDNAVSLLFQLECFQGHWMGILDDTLIHISDEGIDALLGGETVDGIPSIIPTIE